ncbi:MAG TPA: DUF4157 domain-containing protein [Gemmatimonadales bacterium]
MLTDAERAALREIHGDLADVGVRVRRDAGDALRAIVLFLSRGRAVALGRHVFVPRGQEKDVAILAHELMHCRQYEAWGPARYFARGFVEQLRHLLSRAGLARSPYDWRSVPRREFSAYGMEQQGQLVEDACRGDPIARAIVLANASTSSSVVSHDAIHRTSDRPSSHT